MKKKSLPGWLHNKQLSRLIQSEIGTVASYWLFQGMLYMDVRETTLKVILDLMITVLLYSIGINIVICIIFAHTFNMLFNGHFYAMGSHMDRHRIAALNFINYVELLQKRLSKLSFLSGAAAYGSLSRNLFKPTSDIDIRIIPAKGFMNWVCAVTWIFMERARAFWNSFPLDMYAFDVAVIDKKMRSDEPPIIFTDRDQLMVRKYQNHVPFDAFLINFKKKYIQEND